MSFFFFFNDTATTEIYTLSLHDALPICIGLAVFIDLVHLSRPRCSAQQLISRERQEFVEGLDRKSTRLNSSHGYISYAVFCLKKKKTIHISHLERIYLPADGSCVCVIRV